MVKAKQTYGYQTIGSLIQLLQQAVEDNRYLSMNSPVFISDYNMSQQKYEFDVLPSFVPLKHKAGLCLFHSLNEPVKDFEEEIEVEKDLEISEPEETGIVKFANWFRS